MAQLAAIIISATNAVSNSPQLQQVCLASKLHHSVGNLIPHTSGGPFEVRVTFSIQSVGVVFKQ